MARDEAPPFERGSTFANGGTIDSTDLPGPNLEGKVFEFEVNRPGNGAYSVDPSGRRVRCRCVRNVSGVALKPKRVAVYSTSATTPYEGQVDGYVFAVGDRPAGIIDEQLPAAGVPNNDLFWLVIDGPSVVTTVGSGLTSLAVGDRVVPAAGTIKTNDDSGRVQKQDLTGATATLGGNIANTVGYATSVQATSGSDVNVLVHLR